jgi:glycosyltransferase involved in cell wall biosynthesis
MKSEVAVPLFNISVIIPNFNRTDVLVKSIESVLKQTYLPLEIIIVDDRSNIDIDKYINSKFTKECKSGFIKVVVNKKNIGAGKSRNNGVELSKGNFIAFLDSDDYWHEDKLMEQISIFKNNYVLDLVYTDQLLVIDGEFYPSNKKMIKDDVLDNLVTGWTAPNTSTLLYKKSSFELIGGFDANLKSCQDHDLWFKAAIENFKIDFVNKPLSFFVLDSNDRISFNAANRMHGVLLFLKKCKGYMNNTNYKIFKTKYIFDTSFPIFIKSLQSKRIDRAVVLFFKFLFLNKFFYIKLYKKAVGLL